MVNASEMAKIFNKKANDFLENEQTKRFIDEFVQVGNLRLESIVKVIHGGANKGTWMHRKLALKFAGWLSPKFELWVYDVIEEILFGEAKQLRSNNDELRIITNRLNEIDREYSIIGKERYKLAKRQKEILNVNTNLLNDN